MAKRSVVFIFNLSVWLSIASAQPTIFIVRHAERADSSENSELSQAGLARAESLAKTLKDKNITAIYATEFKRTQETGAPLAKALGIKITVRPAKATDFALKLRAEHGNALVVGHSNTIPDLIKALGVSQPIRINENDYDDLFEIVLGKKPKLIHTHYH